MAPISGARLLAKSMADSGIECAFMIEHPDTAPLMEALNAEERIRVVTPTSELSCVPMADGYARSSGRPAAAISAGHGHFLNQVVGVASAWADKSPLLFVSVFPDGDGENSPVFDRENWDAARSLAAITRFTRRVTDPAGIPGAVSRALRESCSGRCGPSHIELSPAAVEGGVELTPALELPLKGAGFRAQDGSAPRGEDALVARAFELLSAAKKPLILAGGGVIRSGAAREINDLAQRLGIPLTSTMGGMGAASPDNPCYMGAASYLSGEAFHAAIREADVVLAVGLCFSGLDGFGLPPLWSRSIRFIQVNVDPEDIAINPPAEVAIVGDAREVLLQMLELAPEDPPAGPSKWLARLRRLDREHLERIRDEASRPWKLTHPALAHMAINRVAQDSDAIAILDGGNTALWAGMLIAAPGPRRGFFLNGMGTLGLGLPLAIGVKAAFPDRPVAIISGDGAFLYNVQELETVRKYKLPIVAVVLNDSAWNMILTSQAFTSGVYGTDLPPQDYTKVARSYGIHGKRITRAEEIEPALREALESGGPSVLDVVIDPDSFPDTLISFIRAEFVGAVQTPAKLLNAPLKGKINWDVRGRNLIKYIRRTM